MFGQGSTEEENQQQSVEEQRKREVALIHQEAQTILAKNDAANIRAGSLVDTAAQVRFAVYGIEVPAAKAGKREKIRYCQIMVGRIVAMSRDGAWEIQRTFEDILQRAESQGSNELVQGDLDSFIFRINSAIATVDPKAMCSVHTGVEALVTTNRSETLNQRVVQSTIGQNQPSILDAFKSVFPGSRQQ
jgi:hypothetical protein